MSTAAPSADAPGLYLHVPFCSAICPYCDFAVRVGRPEARRRFARTLIAEIALAAEAWRPTLDDGASAAFDTIYFGGGTPSLLELEDLASILEALRSGLAVSPDARIYLEANPEDVDRARLAAWRELGVSTLSLGIQSFDAQELAFLGRRHTPEEARRAVELALTADFSTVSIDLIYGLPDQDAAALRRSLELAVRLGPGHVSAYELEVHERTTFGKRRARGELRELDEDGQGDLFVLTHQVLAEGGYPAYEVSNFSCRPRHHSRHNQKYWRHVPYLGLGPSAHSFDGRRRWWNERLLPRWERSVGESRRPVAGEEELDREAVALEMVMLGLRTRAGVDLELLRRRTGVDLVARNAALVERFEQGGLLLREGGRLRPTVAGLAVADRLVAQLEI